MNLKDLFMQDLKTAMKEKQELRKLTITMLRAAVKQIEVDQRIELEDAAIIDIIAKQIKQKKAAIEEFAKGGRQDLVDEANAEIDVLMAYMPQQLSREEIIAIVKDIIQSTGASTMKEMGKVVAEAKDATKGQADGKTLSDVVKELLK
jgi:hypothetical protein